MEREEIYRHILTILDKNNELEHFYFGIVDDSNSCIFKVKLATGSESQVLMPVPVMRFLLKEWGFKRYFMAHNHPSGIGEPGQIDINSTVKLNEEFSKEGFELLGHLIIGNNELGLIGGF